MTTPPMSAQDPRLLDFLGDLEMAESRLLSWGMVDGSFNEGDLEELAKAFLDRRDYDPELSGPSELILRMRQAKLLFDFPGPQGRLYRTRMAEGVRLLVRLRQMFRPHDWRTGPNLVSDYRFVVRPRTYPRRDTTLVDALSVWQQAGVLTPGRKGAIEGLLAIPDFRLAGFQVRATERVLRNLDGAGSKGTIITVGTGSGKTLAFYLPVLAHLAVLVQPDEWWTKAVAIYPRNELLKDQFTETFKQARLLDGIQVAAGRRKLVIGAFFGQTPWKADEELDYALAKWERHPSGRICPYLVCPKCQGDLVWPRASIKARREELQCNACQLRVQEDEVMLTRERMRRTPPDLLFTSTELLNRAMSNRSDRRVFGIGAPRAPQVVLLDEVHTYVGTSGAQAALLLRRWRYAVRSRVQFVGLSATLLNAEEFFAQLTGVKPHDIEEVAPTSSEMQQEGMEYMVVLRGDPVSQTSLLSTTIQSLMLLGRLLDPLDAAGGHGVFGSKVFAFTDDLDVTNRLYDNFRDAEALRWNNTPMANRKPLAALRSRKQPDPYERFVVGQSWAIAEDIGHPPDLARPLTPGRTSSQDTGVNRQASVVIATAALEVGFNDPDVGAVLQHKSPRDMASFVQRKGRAGRRRSMRPWTVVVLSDYGRDRATFQSYELLFDPILPPRVLPIRNRYVLRMQAVYAFMDWLAAHHGDSVTENLYQDFAGPRNRGQYGPQRQARNQSLASLLTMVLDPQRADWQSLQRYVQGALQISSEEARALLWDSPRSVMMHAIPTLLRRLQSDWQRVTLRRGESSDDYIVPNVPLPDFLPPNLFTDLNLPEVHVVAPMPNASPAQASMPVFQALRALTPGKVTRRFASADSRIAHWVPLPVVGPMVGVQELPVDRFIKGYEDLGEFEVLTPDGEPRLLRCLRPWRIEPEKAPSNVAPTSNAWPRWYSQIVANKVGVDLSIPTSASWLNHLEAVTLFTHARQGEVEVRRIMVAAQSSLRLQGERETIESIVHFTDGTGQVGIGAVAHADGLMFRVKLPDEPILASNNRSAAKLRSFRTAYFRRLVLDDAELSDFANPFQRDWLQQTYLSALTGWAIREDITLSQAARAMSPLVSAAAGKVLRTIFESTHSPLEEHNESDGEDQAEDSHADGVGRQMREVRLRDAILELFETPEVVACLERIATVLWEDVGPSWEAWARERYVATIGGALLTACHELHPEAGEGSLVLDVDGIASMRRGGTGDSDRTKDVWITETAIGGGGVIEEIGRRYAEDPRRFYRLVDSALGPSDREVTDAGLSAVCALAVADGPVGAALSEVRNASSHADRARAVEVLEQTLEDKGVLVTRSIMSALHARFTRPGATSAVDRLLHQSLATWQQYEERLGVEVDLRVFAYLQSGETDVRQLLSEVVPGLEESDVARFHAIYGLLWPRGHAIRSVALNSYNPFGDLPDSDRLLVLDHVEGRLPTILVTDAEWRAQVVASLREHGHAFLGSRLEERAQLSEAVTSLLVEPVEIDFLRFYPRVDGLRRDGNLLVASLTIPEVVQ